MMVENNALDPFKSYLSLQRYYLTSLANSSRKVIFRDIAGVGKIEHVSRTLVANNKYLEHSTQCLMLFSTHEKYWTSMPT